METVLAVLVGILVAAGVYLMLARNILRFLFGLILISNAVNLAILAAGRLEHRAPPLVPPGLERPPVAVANALPQALVLTAIVIGFGLLAFALVLVYRGYLELGTLDTDAMREAEPRRAAKGVSTDEPGGGAVDARTSPETDAAPRSAPS